MQKKSLLVALFCGALCLTGCLKNEESASVVQVRNAKANELNSIATLNEAKAAAELIYANADATLKGAEAELKKAEAALVLAMAETEKVRAELLKTQVALQEVKVEEEGIELLKKAAELEILLAQAEVAQAKAEADKQYWANELEQLIADAEVAAVKNGLELLKAEEAVNAYILEMEGAKADSAKVYAKKYFKAQEKVAELQVAELAARAARVLIENNAMSTREYIHNEIDKKNDSIAANNAKIEALKKYLDVDPETAKAALAKAWTEYNETYNDYQKAIDAKNAAQDAFLGNQTKQIAGIVNKIPDFTWDWDNQFRTEIVNIFGTNGLKMYDNTGTIDVKVGDVTIEAKVAGINVPDKENEGETKFIPFWSEETRDDEPERYPDIYVSEYKNNKPVDYVVLNNTSVAPAQIFFENIHTALDKVVAGYKSDLDESVEDFKEYLNGKKEGTEEDPIGWQDEIDANTKLINLHKDYVKAREAKVVAAENAYISELKKHETYLKEKADAWEEFEKHMVKNHDETRALFISRNRADSAYDHAVKDTVKALGKLIEIATGIPALEEKVAEKFEAMAKAEGDYNDAKEAAFAEGAGGDILEDIAKAKLDWDPDFAALLEAEWTPKTDAQLEDVENVPGLQQYPEGAEWYFPLFGGRKIEAGTSQNAAQTNRANYELASERRYKAKIDDLRGIDGEDDIYDAADDLCDELDEAYGSDTETGTIKHTVKTKKKVYDDSVEEYKDYAEDLAAAEAKWNPDFNVFTVCTFPTEARPTVWFTCNGQYYNEETGEWATGSGPNREVAGSAQAELLDAVYATSEAYIQFKGSSFGQDEPTALDEWNSAKWAFRIAQGNLFQANYALMTALGAEIPEDITTPWDLAKYVEDNIDEYIDEEAEKLYAKYKAVVDESHIDTAADTLEAFYGLIHPDAIAQLILDAQTEKYRVLPTDRTYEDAEKPNAKDPEQFGWLVSKYHTDYKATMLNKDGERVPIASALFKNKKRNETQKFTVEFDEETGKFSRKVSNWVYYDEEGNEVSYNKAPRLPDYSHSLTWENERIQKKIDAIPDLIKSAQTIADDLVKTKKANIDVLKGKLDAYDTYKGDYLNWIDDCKDAEEKYNQAQKDEFDAKEDLNKAEAEYMAAEAAADGEVWLYDRNKTKKVTMGWYQTEVADPGFVKVSIPEAIKAIEAENEEIEARKHELELGLKYGKLTYQTVMEVLDETIEVLSADIEIWTAIANQYKAVMNGYLGIVDGEATPVVEEGEDEE